MCKSRSLSRNQPHELNLPSNAHNFVNTTQNCTKPPPKEVRFQEISINLQMKAI